MAATCRQGRVITLTFTLFNSLENHQARNFEINIAQEIPRSPKTTLKLIKLR